VNLALANAAKERARKREEAGAADRGYLGGKSLITSRLSRTLVAAQGRQPRKDDQKEVKKDRNHVKPQ